LIRKEKKQQEGIATTIKDAPNWDEKLASASEAIVKAERSRDRSFEELERETIEILHKKDKKSADELLRDEEIQTSERRI